HRGHIPGPPGSLAPADVGVMGPLGRSAADLALGLDVLAGPAGDDAAAWRLDLPPARNGGALVGLRVATWFDDPSTPIAADTRALLDRAAQALAGDGATVTEAGPPVGLGELVRSWERLVLPIVTAGLSDDDFAAFAEAAAPAGGDEPREVRAVRAITARHRDWLGADERRHQHRRRFAEFFEHHDVLLAPVMPTAAFPHDTERDMVAREVDVDGVARPYLDGLSWAGGIGTLLLPVAVPPIGRTPRGLPVGVQVVAPHLHDRTAVAVAGHVERLLGGFVPPPALAGPAPVGAAARPTPWPDGAT
ncbi:MAG TPA: amidase family protein, partial [Acidimicrobiales bacterium]